MLCEGTVYGRDHDVFGQGDVGGGEEKHTAGINRVLGGGAYVVEAVRARHRKPAHAVDYKPSARVPHIAAYGVKFIALAVEQPAAAALLYLGRGLARLRKRGRYLYHAAEELVGLVADKDEEGAVIGRDHVGGENVVARRALLQIKELGGGKLGKPAERWVFLSGYIAVKERDEAVCGRVHRHKLEMRGVGLLVPLEVEGIVQREEQRAFKQVQLVFDLAADVYRGAVDIDILGDNTSGRGVCKGVFDAAVEAYVENGRGRVGGAGH